MQRRFQIGGSDRAAIALKPGDEFAVVFGRVKILLTLGRSVPA